MDKYKGHMVKTLEIDMFFNPTLLIMVVVMCSTRNLSQKMMSMAISTKACFGAGCYWGTEKFLKSDFASKFPNSGSIKSGKVGFMGPPTAKPNPTYREVCNGDTGHVEVYDFEFSGDEKTYENLVRHFFMFHDPTTLNRQGNDRGTQYASAIFYYDKTQQEIANKVKNEFQSLLSSGKVKNYQNKEVTTAILEATKFYSAEDYHQEYLDKNPNGYCNHFYSETPHEIDEQTQNKYEHSIVQSNRQTITTSDIESARSLILELMEDCWRKIPYIITINSLPRCEEDLRMVTNLLVFATIKRSANQYPSSSRLLEGMLALADQNKDAQLSYNEWYEWLGSSVVDFDSNIQPTITESDLNFESSMKSEESNSKLFCYSDDKPRLSSQTSTFNPLITALSLVLKNAIATFQVVARLPFVDSNILTASFVAGGVAAGLLDEDISRIMLSRLSPPCRELVIKSLSIESSSISTTMLSMMNTGDPMTLSMVNTTTTSSLPYFTSNEPMLSTTSLGDNLIYSLDKPRGAVVSEVRPASEDTEPTHSVVEPSPTLANPSEASHQKTVETKSPDEIFMDHQRLSDQLHHMDVSIPIPMERKWNTPVDGEESVLRKKLLQILHQLASSCPSMDQLKPIDIPTRPAVHSTFDHDDILLAMNQSTSTVAISNEPTLDIELFSQSSTIEPSDSSSDPAPLRPNPWIKESFPPIYDADTEVISTSNATDLMTSSSSYASSESLDDVLRRITFIMNDLIRVRETVCDIDDQRAKMLRKVLTEKSQNDPLVLGFAFALRTARLQHATKRYHSYASRQQLALDTLQLWAPLSYQVGLSKQCPELELNSYVILFPQSFQNFISWYNAFKPIGKKIIMAFQSDVEYRIRSNQEVKRLCSRVKIQSRLKAAPSAFKKMIGKAKLRDELFDALGVRIIIQTRADRVQMEDVQDSCDENDVMIVLDDHHDSSRDGRKEGGHGGEDGRDGRDGKEVGGEEAEVVETTQQDTSSNIRSCWSLYHLLNGMHGWYNDLERFKDYISDPKPSGYQSLHLSLMHQPTGIYLEVQIRSIDMHWVAEHGMASHKYYKALILPVTTNDD